MAVSIAQTPGYATGSGTTFPISLPGAPTPGNLMVAIIATGYLATNPTLTGWVQAFVPSGLASVDMAVMYRVVQAGDTAGPYTFPGNQNGYDWGAQIVELAGAGSSPSLTFSAINASWTQSTTSEPSPSLATSAGSYANFFFSVYCASTDPTLGSPSMSAGTFDQAEISSSSVTEIVFFGYGHQLFASSGTASSVFTAAGCSAIANSTQTTAVLVVAQAVVGGTTGNGASVSVIGNNGEVPPMYPIPPGFA